MAHPVRSIFILAFIYFVATFGNAMAGDDLVIGAGAWEPYVTFSGHGEYGLAVDKLRLLSQETGYHISLQVFPFIRAVKYAETGTIDGVLLAAKRPEREAYMNFTEPLFCDRRYLYMRADATFDWSKPEQLSNKMIGVGRGFHNGPIVQDWIDKGKIQVMTIDTPEQLLRILNAGRVDFVAFSEREADVLIDRLGFTGKIRRAGSPLAAMELRMAFTKQHDGAERAKAFDRAIDKLGLAETCD